MDTTALKLQRQELPFGAVLVVEADGLISSIDAIPSFALKTVVPDSGLKKDYWVSFTGSIKGYDKSQATSIAYEAMSNAVSALLNGGEWAANDHVAVDEQIRYALVTGKTPESKSGALYFDDEGRVEAGYFSAPHVHFEFALAGSSSALENLEYAPGVMPKFTTDKYLFGTFDSGSRTFNLYITNAGFYNSGLHKKITSVVMSEIANEIIKSPLFANNSLSLSGMFLWSDNDGLRTSFKKTVPVGEVRDGFDCVGTGQ